MKSVQRKAAAALISATVSLAGLAAGCQQQDSFVPPPPPDVTVSKPLRRSVPDYVEYTGSTKAQETVDLRARVKGFLKERNFDEKTRIKKDQLLFVIDEEPFKVALEMAQAKLAESEASLKKAEQSKSKEVATATLALDQATLGLARIDERRSKSLLDRNAGTKEALDQAEATRKKAEAQVEADQASLDQASADYQTNILSARANVLGAKSDVRNAEINLGYCRITAPFDGWITRRLFDVGNLVGDGSASVLATIYKDDPIYAYMNVSENDLLRFRQLSREGQRASYEKGDEIKLDLGLANEKGFPHAGILDYSNPSVDATTGTVLARGRFDNPDRIILPGLFVRVRVVPQERPNALLVPERALGTEPLGRYLLVVRKDNKVEKLPVSIGSQEGEFRVITEGLKEDDLVIVKGLQKAREGSVVKPSIVEQAMPPTSTVAQAPTP